MSRMSQWASEIFHEERFRGRLMDDEERMEFYRDRLTLKAETKPAQTGHKPQHDERPDDEQRAKQ